MSSGSGGRGLARRLAFFKSLQALNARIHAAEDIDQIIASVSEESQRLCQTAKSAY